jgi:hypothetical protein
VNRLPPNVNNSTEEDLGFLRDDDFLMEGNVSQEEKDSAAERLSHLERLSVEETVSPLESFHEEIDSLEGKKGAGKVSQKRKRKYSEEVKCDLVAGNSDHMLVMHALYVHRRLTIGQICNLYFRKEDMNRIRANMVRLLDIGLLEKKRVFAVAQTLAEARTYHYNLSLNGIRIYALVGMNINMLHDDPDLPKQHFLLNDLTIGAQVDHHFLLQDFVCKCLGQLWKEEIYLPNCEWRRFPYVPSEQEQSVYRPDWIFFKPSAYFKQLIADNRIGEDVLSVPVLSRGDSDRLVIQEHYHPYISIECDTGTMRQEKIAIKFERIREEKKIIPRAIGVLVSEGKLGEEKSRWNVSRTRIRNMGTTISSVLKVELRNDELIVLIGRQSTLVDGVNQYIRTEGNLHTLFAGVPDMIKGLWPQSKKMERVEWNLSKVEAGLPDVSFTLKDKKVAIYYTIPGWLNPFTKAEGLLAEGIGDIRVILLYPNQAALFDSVQFTQDNVLFALLDEWSVGNRTLYKRITDRSGISWEAIQEI